MMRSKIIAHGAAPTAGYTILELLVVLVIIGLIAAVATPQVMTLLGSARHDSAELQMKSLVTSLEFYQLDTGSYPGTDPGLTALWRRPEGVRRWRGPYIREEDQLADPWGRRYLYARPDDMRGFSLRSLGADGRDGGEGDDADIQVGK